MSTILRYLEFLSLGTWVGSIVFLSFVVAPGALALFSRDQAGALVGFALGRLHVLGLVCGVVYLAAHVARARSLPAFVELAAIAVILMLALTLVSQYWISPKLADLRAEMKTQFGSVDVTPADNQLRAAFGRLHGISTSIELAVLLAGLVALYLTVRARPA